MSGNDGQRTDVLRREYAGLLYNEFGDHADCHNFLVSMRAQRQSEVKFGEFTDPNLLLVPTKRRTYKALRICTPHCEQCDFINKVNRINIINCTYLENSTVSVNATTSVLSFVAANCPIPTSATPLVTSANIPVHDPLPDLEPYASAL